MATLTVVITYTGTLGVDEEVQSWTSAGTAYASLTPTQVNQTNRLLRKAAKRAMSDKGSQLRGGNHS